MGFTRRDLLKFTGGSAAGLALTPVPWSLLRDIGCPVRELAGSSPAARTAKFVPGIPPARFARRDAVCAPAA